MALNRDECPDAKEGKRRPPPTIKARLLTDAPSSRCWVVRATYGPMQLGCQRSYSLDLRPVWRGDTFSSALRRWVVVDGRNTLALLACKTEKLVSMLVARDQANLPAASLGLRRLRSPPPRSGTSRALVGHATQGVARVLVD